MTEPRWSDRHPWAVMAVVAAIVVVGWWFGHRDDEPAVPPPTTRPVVIVPMPTERVPIDSDLSPRLAPPAVDYRDDERDDEIESLESRVKCYEDHARGVYPTNSDPLANC